MAAGGGGTAGEDLNRRYTDFGLSAVVVSAVVVAIIAHAMSTAASAVAVVAVMAIVTVAALATDVFDGHARNSIVRMPNACR